jgi:hypothetical protein
MRNRAFDIFERMGVIFEIPDNEQRYTAMAADYVASVKEGKTTLMIAPTHMECDLVTEKVRQALKENRTLSDGREWNILRNLSWSPAQKSDGRCYEPGLVVKVGGHLKGFSMGEELEVVEAQRSEVIVRRQDGRRRSLPLAEAEKFNVYERDKIEVCKGELLRITVNTRSMDDHPLDNGRTYTVKEFARDGGIILENGWRLRGGFPYLAYGYAKTSNSAQSQTVDRVLIAQSGLISSGATDANQVYTAVARGREFPHIYTDCLEGLRDAAARVRTRYLATEILRDQVAAEEQRAKVAQCEPEPQPRRRWRGTQTEVAVEPVAVLNGEVACEPAASAAEREAEHARVLELEAEEEEMERELELEIGM